MNQSILLIAAAALMAACSGETKPADESSEALKEQTETLEKSAKELDETIQASTAKIDSIQQEIDQLLNDI